MRKERDDGVRLFRALMSAFFAGLAIVGESTWEEGDMVGVLAVASCVGMSVLAGLLSIAPHRQEPPT